MANKAARKMEVVTIGLRETRYGEWAVSTGSALFCRCARASCGRLQVGLHGSCTMKAAMKVKRISVNLRHVAAFLRPAVGLVTQSGRLLDSLMEQLATAYAVPSSDVTLKSGSRLDDWSIRISLFNGLGRISITCDGVESGYTRLGSDKDISVVTDVQRRVLTAISSHSPDQKYLSESVGGGLNYAVVDGPASRDEYFSRLSFPGKTSLHEDVGFKARIRSPQHDIIGSFDVAPTWADKAHLFVSFDVDTSNADIQDFAERAKVVRDLIDQALTSFDIDALGD